MNIDLALQQQRREQVLRIERERRAQTRRNCRHCNRAFQHVGAHAIHEQIQCPKRGA